MSSRTLFIRSFKNVTIAEIEISQEKGGNVRDLSCAVDIAEYSRFLLKHLDEAADIIADFASISEIRGWYWERARMETERYDEILNQLRKMMQGVAMKYDLTYAED